MKRSIHFSKMGSPQDVFTSIYTANNWGNTESISGHGSSAEYTENIRKEIPTLLAQLKTDTILDAPCGDYNWFRLIDRGAGFTYIGGDIVKPLILKNRDLYENETTIFLDLDIIHDKLPAAGLWLCRDCLFHFSYDDVFTTIQNFLRSDIRYLLTSTHTECRKNSNITTGDFRLINLELPPFNFGKPKMYIADWIEGYPVRHLGLWDKEELSAAMAANRQFSKKGRD
ncbi:MAG: class I SAM-dependent methyltransferase [Bacteroidetes bacterium]|nr:class I SAM-dependent methyltransferase [Bacteroidota bacterium]